MGDFAQIEKLEVIGMAGSSEASPSTKFRRAQALSQLAADAR